MATRAQEITNPIYLVVDTTLDFHKIKVGTLFPEGVPPNVFLIFTPSHAKLHQHGMDIVTGGLVSLYSHPRDQVKVLRLKAEFEETLNNEGSRQGTFELRIPLHLYYRHIEAGTAGRYVDYMIRKRERNTAALLDQIAITTGRELEQTAPGEYQFREPKTGRNELLISDQEIPGLVHRAQVTFHYEPKAPIHAYLKVLEPETPRYIASKVFEEIKRRVFRLAAADGIQVADGTSWGFVVTRLGDYMHTLRIAVGLEHSSTCRRFGTIFGSVVKELLRYPEDFLKGTGTAPMTRGLISSRREELMALDRLIPQGEPTPFSYYEEERPGRLNYSFVMQHGTALAGMLFAYLKEDEGEQVVYLSKAATSPECQGRGYFRRLLEQLVDRARADGLHRIVLYTSASRKNEPVVRAYERCGFRVSALEGQMLPNGWPLFLVKMELRIDRAPRETSFTPVADETYQQVKDSGDLSGALARLVSVPRPQEQGQTLS